jgi:hypothetical protein
LRVWRNFTRTAFEGLDTSFRILRLGCDSDLPEHLRGGSVVCVQGLSVDPDAARRLEQQLRFLARPLHGGWVAAARARSTPLLDTDKDAWGDGLRIGKLDDWAIESFLRVAGPGSPLLSAELRQLGGALAAPPIGAGARGHLEGRFLLFGVGVPGMPAPAPELEAHLDRYLEAMRPWATGTRFTSFAERTDSLATCVPDAALRRLRRIRAASDPNALLRPSHVPH